MVEINNTGQRTVSHKIEGGVCNKKESFLKTTTGYKWSYINMALKALETGSTLARLMPNVGWPREINGDCLGMS